MRIYLREWISFLSRTVGLLRRKSRICDKPYKPFLWASRDGRRKCIVWCRSLMSSSFLLTNLTRKLTRNSLTTIHKLLKLGKNSQILQTYFHSLKILAWNAGCNIVRLTKNHFRGMSVLPSVSKVFHSELSTVNVTNGSFSPIN